jgi:uncharacterized protein with ParB-like and HNH nuclease domain
MKASDIKLLDDLISEQNRQFRIPVYQRDYVWSQQQCDKLFNDILLILKNKDKKHFLGTIVYLRSDESDSKQQIDILVDGQQRISTLLILLRAAHDLANEKGNSTLSKYLNRFLFNKEETGNFKLKVKPFNSSDLDFEKVILGEIDVIENQNNTNYLINYLNFKERLNDLSKNNIELDDFINAIRNLTAVEIILKDKVDDPQAIFESINSTGVPLKESDKIRNYILMSEKDQDRLYRLYWSEIEKNCGEHIDDFFVNFLNLKKKEFIKSKNVYNKFKEYKIESNKSNEEILIELKELANLFAYLTGLKIHPNTEVNKYLGDLRILDQTTVFQFLIPLLADSMNEIISSEELASIIRLIVNYSLRRIVCEIPSNRLQALYKRMYSKIFPSHEHKVDYLNKIKSYLDQLNTIDKFPENSIFIDSFKNNNLYNKKNVCKFILATIENGNKKENINIDSLNIEHIMPQSKKENWQNHIGEEYEETHAKYLHTIGNLTLTGYNSELGTKSFEEKKKIINENSKMKIINEEILISNIWNKNSIIKRADSLTERLITIFDHKTPDKKYNFFENQTTFGFEEFDQATKRRPVSFTFEGIKTIVDSYADMQKKFLLELYNLDSEKLFKIADKEVKLNESSKTMISRSRTKILRPKKLEEIELFYDSNLSGSDIVRFCYKLIQLFDLDEQEFGYELANL